MAAITVRNLPDDVHRALRLRAAGHGRSTEAEIRDILEAAVKPPSRVLMGDALAALGQELGFTESDLTFDRDLTPAKPMNFE